jgi:hypothetical protein
MNTASKKVRADHARLIAEIDKIISAADFFTACVTQDAADAKVDALWSKHVLEKMEKVQVALREAAWAVRA